MMHKAWSSIEVFYYFSRSSIKFQGNTGQINRWFETNLSKVTKSVAAIKSHRFALFTYDIKFRNKSDKTMVNAEYVCTFILLLFQSMIVFQEYGVSLFAVSIECLEIQATSM